jgi:hypothetical protein
MKGSASRSEARVSEHELRTVEVCDRPVFIIGSPRSGTSILAWSLAHHAQFWTSRECHAYFELFGGSRAEKAFAADSGPDSWFAEEGVSVYEYLISLGLGISALFTKRSGGLRWIDQTPANTYMVNTWREMFPNARFLHILRDPRRVVWSMMNFGGPLSSEDRAEKIASKALPAWSANFESACETWRDTVTVAMDFCSRDAERGMTVRLEDLVADPRKEFAEIFAFLDVDEQQEPAGFFASSRINSSFAPDRWGSPDLPALTSPDGDRGWRDSWEHWTDEQRAIFAREIGPVFERWGLSYPSLPALTTTSDG